MNLIILSSFAACLYVLASVWLGYRFFSPEPAVRSPDARLIIISCLAISLHAIVLYQLVFTDMGLNLGFYNALSLVSWSVALFVILTMLVKPTENLAMIILPVTAVSLFAGFFFSSDRIISESENIGLNIHIILSIAAYSLLTLAAIQSVVLAIQERRLRSKHPVQVMRILPPLQTMEELLVQLLGLGFFLLSLSLATGLMFVFDIHEQHLTHKTVLSLLAWLFYGLVLFGRWAWGWRGKYLIRLTLGGFILLMLAYFGSKFVLELILHRV